MNFVNRQRWISCLLATGFVVLTSFAAGRPPTAELEARDPWVRWLPGGLPAAGYLILINASAHDVFLTGITSQDYSKVQVHESYTTPEGAAGMRPIAKLRVPAREEVRLAPGGYHLMLVDAQHRVDPGDVVTIELVFADGRRLPVRMPVKPANYSP